MSRPTRTKVDTTKALVFGAPGSITLTQYRHAITTYRQIPLKWLALTATLIIAVTTAAAHSIGYSPTTALLTTTAILLAADFATRAPHIAATTAVVAIGSVLMTPFSYIFAVAVDGSRADPEAAVAILSATLALTGLLAHRTSRGRPWLTTLIVAAAIMFVGPFLVVYAPILGFAWAWLTMAVVLFLRGSGKPWLLDQAATLSDLIRRRKVTPTELPEATQKLATKHDAEVATGTLLAELPNTYTVLHDRAHNTTRLDHLIVGPTGIHLIESQKLPGAITNNPTKGLTHPKTNLATILNTTATTARALTKTLNLNRDVTPIVVIHDADLPTDTATVELTTKTKTLAHVTVTAPHTLLDAIAQTNTTPMSPRQVRRAVTRIDRRCPPAKPTTDTNLDVSDPSTTLTPEPNN